MTRREMTAILREFEDDEKNGVWQWFGVTSELLEKARIWRRAIWPALRNMASTKCIQTTATCWRLRATFM